MYNLPELFFDGRPSGINIHFYKTDKSSRNNKVSFSQNLICIMLAGKKEVSGQYIHEKFDKSHLYILCAGNVLMTETATSENIYESILLFFSNEYLIDFLHRNKVPLVKAKQAIQSLKVDKDDFLSNYEKSLDILKDSFVSNENLIRSKIDEIMLYLLQTHNESICTLYHTILKNDRNTSLSQTVLTNQNNNLTVEELAFLCHMSVSTFKRKFAETFQTTPKQYFIARRMQKAILLLHENKRPSEIYEELGYANLSAFSNEFKKHFGSSPKSYLLQHEPSE